MGFVGQGMDAGRINPPVVEIEERADGDREVQRFVCPASRARHVEIGGRDPRRIVIDLVDEPEQRLVLLVERR
jgi:hypothetical protein